MWTHLQQYLAPGVNCLRCMNKTRRCPRFLCLFSLLGKLAEMAIYFANVFFFTFYIFNGRLSNTCCSEANGPIGRRV